MTDADLVKLLSERFYENFADEAARAVLGADAVDRLYAVTVDPHPELPKSVRHKVLFRGAYVLERIYFTVPECFMPHAGEFCRRDFPACADASVRRHFGKIMADLLGRYEPEPETLDRIAEAAAEWAVRCRGRVGWVDESWDDIVGAMAVDPTPGIECRMRKSWRKV